LGGYNAPVTPVLRDFRADDFETLWSIDQRCFEPGIAYERRELMAYIGLRSAFTLVAESAAEASAQLGSMQQRPAQILGFLVAHCTRKGLGHIITIDVLAEARRLGVGSLLLTEAEARLRAVPCHRVTLETAVDNASALAFYKRHHYFVVKTVPRYYSNGMDALVLQKDFEQPV